MYFKLDKHDIELIYQSICYFDMYEDGKYEKWFGKNADKVNDSYHYLYSLCDEYRNKSDSLSEVKDTGNGDLDHKIDDNIVDLYIKLIDTIKNVPRLKK